MGKEQKQFGPFSLLFFFLLQTPTLSHKYLYATKIKKKCFENYYYIIRSSIFYPFFDRELCLKALKVFIMNALQSPPQTFSCVSMISEESLPYFYILHCL